MSFKLLLELIVQSKSNETSRYSFSLMRDSRILSFLTSISCAIDESKYHFLARLPRYKKDIRYFWDYKKPIHPL